MKSEPKSSTKTEPIRPVVTRKAHRAGPVEAEPLVKSEEARYVQRCLRCDTLLRVVTPARDPLKPGARVFAGTLCRGTIDPPNVLQYEDE